MCRFFQYASDFQQGLIPLSRFLLHRFGRDLLGNRQADRLAGDAARSVELPPAVTTPVLYDHGLVRCIQRRLIDILINLPSRQKVSKDVKHITSKPQIVDLLPVTSHLAFVSKGRVCCARCHENYLQKDPAETDLCLYLSMRGT